MNADRLDLDALLADLDEPTPDGFRAGLACFVGRPNVGKSTLLNALLGQKVAIVTDVPGTTRNAIRGVVERADAQLVVVDTPGVTKPRTLLSQRLNQTVRETWANVDVICLLVDARAGIGAGDQFLASQLREMDTPVVVVVTKEDAVTNKNQMMPVLSAAAALVPGAEVVPTAIPNVGSGSGPGDTLNLDVLVDVLVGHLPQGSRLLPAGTVTDQPERHLAAEILREKLIHGKDQELPHSIAVTIDEIVPSDDNPDVLVVDAVVHVERDSQKGIVIGRGGEHLQAANAAARMELEALLGSRVFLTTHVKVAKEWQRDPKRLRRLGY